MNNPKHRIAPREVRYPAPSPNTLLASLIKTFAESARRADAALAHAAGSRAEGELTGRRNAFREAAKTCRDILIAFGPPTLPGDDAPESTAEAFPETLGNGRDTE